MAALPRPQPDAEVEAADEAAALEAEFGHLDAAAIVSLAAGRFGGEVAVVSSFGADSAALLHIVSRVDPALPVLFLDTGKHFDETLDYRDRLAEDLGLADLQIIRPLAENLARFDPKGDLNRRDTDACCDIRKVEPMARAVAPFSAWLTGRKRHQAASRGSLPVFEAVGSRIRINPLAGWTTADQASYMRRYGLRENPLVAYGYLSIGCLPCTEPVKAGDDPRSGRWAGQAKTECGIHLSGLDQSLTSSSL